MSETITYNIRPEIVEALGEGSISSIFQRVYIDYAMENSDHLPLNIPNIANIEGNIVENDGLVTVTMTAPLIEGKADPEQYQAALREITEYMDTHLVAEYEMAYTSLFDHSQLKDTLTHYMGNVEPNALLAHPVEFFDAAPNVISAYDAIREITTAAGYDRDSSPLRAFKDYSNRFMQQRPSDAPPLTYENFVDEFVEFHRQQVATEQQVDKAFESAMEHQGVLPDRETGERGQSDGTKEVITALDGIIDGELSTVAMAELTDTLDELNGVSTAVRDGQYPSHIDSAIERVKEQMHDLEVVYRQDNPVAADQLMELRDSLSRNPADNDVEIKGASR